ncbi:MAG: MFS transporter [Candidatus Krumholzibacteriota bacterium]|nr:MFS transporter [Candidatus Krumholzibacteriota bacterium]
MRIENRKEVISWAMYDWGNSAFATTVIAGFFPVFFNSYWSAGADTTITTARLGLGNSLAGLSIALIAPLLGAIADRGGLKKRFLIFFACFGAVMTTGLYLVSRGQWVAAVMIYLLASIGFSGSLVFYDALLKTVAREREYDFVSSLGYSLGYLGGGVLFAINLWMTLDPGRFGFDGTEQAVRFSFLTAGVWWALFTIPLIVNVRENDPTTRSDLRKIISEGAVELAATFRLIRRRRNLLLFLIAYWLYIDGVDTVVRMAVDYGMSIGLDQKDLITALLMTQFIGFPSAIIFGIAGGRIGAKKAIFIAIGVYLVVSVLAAFIRSRSDFYLLAVIIGLVQGGVQALSRAYYSRMIPDGKSAEYFGFYNMTGKFAVVVGPLLIGSVGLLARASGFSADISSRISISSISILFIGGAVVFYFSSRVPASGPIADSSAPPPERRRPQ